MKQEDKRQDVEAYSLYDLLKIEQKELSKLSLMTQSKKPSEQPTHQYLFIKIA